MRAQDLEKALEPSVWPMGVKVRQWIHYPSRRQGQERNDKNRDGQFRSTNRRQHQPVTDEWSTVPGMGNQVNNEVNNVANNVNNTNRFQHMEIEDEMYASQQS